MIIMASVFLIVYALRRLAVPYAWQIALGCGVAAYIVLVMVGGFFMTTSMTVGGVIPGILAAVIIGEAIIFFRCGLEYKKTNRLQFEDDDYYYYVKMVPKVDGNHRASETKEPEMPAAHPKRNVSVRPEMTESVRQRQEPMDDLESRLEKAMRQIQE